MLITMYGLIPLDTNDKDKFGLSGDIKVSLFLGETVQADLLALSLLVLFDIGLCTFEDDLTFCLGSLAISVCTRKIV
jgi:hypothetical protein